MIPRHLDFNYLKRAVSIARVLDDKGLTAQFRARGDKLTGPCPVHGGDNPQAFVANLSKNIWHCFTGCNGGGDVIELVRKMDRISHRRVAHYLSSLAGCAPALHATRPPPAKPYCPFIRRLCLNPFAPLLAKKQIHPKTARWFEAGAWHGPGFLKDCIGVRLHDPKGNPVGYAGRRVNSMDMITHGKWNFPAGLAKSSLLYNYHRVRSYIGRGLVVVECPWAVMRLAQLAIPAVALLGTSLSTTQIDLLRNVPRIILMLDGDRAGENAAGHIRKILDSVIHIQTFQLPEGLDPDDLNDYDLNKVAHLFLS
jgi:DNA primase